MVYTVNDGPELFAEIVVFSALEQSLHYRVPEELHGQAQVGKRVLIPLGRRESLGLLVGLQTTAPQLTPAVAIRSILAVVDSSPTVPEDLIALCRWIAQYYFYPLGEVLKSALPANIQLRPEVFYRITATGREALANASRPVLLELFQREADLSRVEINQQFPARKGVQKELNVLETRGWLERYYVWKEPAARHKTV
jgi:primosomal protein N' (replication factor Y)